MVLRRLVLTAALVGSLWGGLPAEAQDVAGAQQFVAELATQAIHVMTSPGIPDADRREQFRKLFIGAADMPSIGRLVLGRYWRVATPDQRSRFLKLFEDLMVYTWSNRFKNVSGNVRLQINGASPDPGGGVRIDSVIVRQNQEPVAVAWRMRPVEGAWRIFDLDVAGTSMIATYRDEYASVIAQNGGSVAALNQALARKLQQLAQGAPP